MDTSLLTNGTVVALLVALAASLVAFLIATWQLRRSTTDMVRLFKNASQELTEEAGKLERLNMLILEGLHQAKIIKLSHKDGKLTGIAFDLTASSGMSFDGTADLEDANAPD